MLCYETRAMRALDTRVVEEIVDGLDGTGRDGLDWNRILGRRMMDDG